jgi:hypothetical protein
LIKGDREGKRLGTPGLYHPTSGDGIRGGMGKSKNWQNLFSEFVKISRNDKKAKKNLLDVNSQNPKIFWRNPGL